MIDMQRDFYAAEGFAARAGKPVGSMQAIVNPINEFANTLRQKGCMILFTQFLSSPTHTPANLQEVAKRNNYNHTCQAGSGGEDFAGITPQTQDIVIAKYSFDGFAGTELLAKLKAAQIENVIICGVRSEICVDATAKRASAEGFRTLVAKDLIATYDNRKSLTEEFIRIFDNYYGIALESQQILAMLS